MLTVLQKTDNNKLQTHIILPKSFLMAVTIPVLIMTIIIILL